MKQISLFLTSLFLLANCTSKIESPIIEVHSQKNQLLQTQKLEESPKQINELQSFSPKDIVDYLNDNEKEPVENIWKHFGIEESDDFRDLLNKYTNYKAEEIAVNLDTDKIEDIVLKIYGNGGGGYRYLLFRRIDKFNFEYSGYYDVIESRYLDPTFRVVRIKDKSWFAVKQSSGGGTGVSRFIETWTPVTKGNSKVAFEYVYDGHDSNRDLWDRSFGAKIQRQGFFDGKYTLELRTWIDYFISSEKGFDDIKNFSKHQIGVYVLDGLSGEFVLQKSKSTITEEELENVFNYEEPLGRDKFFQYSFAELKQIAQDRDKLQIIWLKKVLEQIGESEQKHQLQEMLDKQFVSK